MTVTILTRLSIFCALAALYGCSSDSPVGNDEALIGSGMDVVEAETSLPSASVNGTDAPLIALGALGSYGTPSVGAASVAEPLAAQSVDTDPVNNPESTQVINPAEPVDVEIIEPDAAVLVPEAVEPEVIEPEVIEPEVIEPEVIEPEVIEPEVIEPEVIEPEVIEPEVIEPEVIEPEVIEPEVIEPEVIEPEVIEPEVIEPEVIEPEVVEPEVVEPEVVEPNTEPENSNNGNGSLIDTVETSEPTPAPAVTDVCTYPDKSSTLQQSWTDGKSGSSVPNYQSTVDASLSNTKLTRMSSNSVWGLGNGNAVHHYSKRQAWNADETLLDIGERTVDANSLNIVNGIIPLSSARNWSNLQPNIMFGIQYNPEPNEFVAANVVTNEITLLRKFPNYNACTLGDYEGNVSNDDSKVMLTCTEKSSGQRTHISYDITNNTILGTLPAEYNFNWGGFSQKGEYILIENNTYPDANPRLIRYDPDLTNPMFITSVVEHGDFGFDDNGDEVYVMLLWDVIYYYRLSDGKRVDLSVSGNGNNIGWGHLSCRNHNRPGWCYYSSSNASRVGAVKISETDSVMELWGFHRSNYGNYSTQPKGTSSRSGDKYLFISDWYGRGETNDYMFTCQQ